MKVITLVEQVRCKDAGLQAKLNILRTAIPSKRQLDDIKRGHRAWKTPEPTVYDVLELLRAHPDTTIVTCTRKASALVNDLAVQVLFRDRHRRSLSQVPFDYESNVKNYTAKGKLKAGPLEPASTEIFEGQRVFLTRNLDKENGFVNGMPAIIEGYDPRSKCLHVVTKLGKSLAVHLYTEDVEGHGRITHFPVRLGCAGTVQKIQGATLPHVTVWLDRPGCRAACAKGLIFRSLDIETLSSKAFGLEALSSKACCQ